MEIDKIRMTSFKPSTNGASERVHRTLNTMLGKIVGEQQRDWDNHVAYVLAAYVLAATVRFPTMDRDILRRTIMTVMMTQRRCVVRLTRAGLRRGPRTDSDGNSFVELDLDYADRYSMSHKHYDVMLKRTVNCDL